MERNQRTRDEGETTKPAENEGAIDLEKPIDVDCPKTVKRKRKCNYSRRNNRGTPKRSWKL
jgi:hypothetical protein